jgi:hypothetical protein
MLVSGPAATRHYVYSFDALARTLAAFTDALHLTRYALYTRVSVAVSPIGGAPGFKPCPADIATL